MSRKFLQRWTERSEIQVHAAYASVLKFCDTFSYSARDEQLYRVLPILGLGVVSAGPRVVDKQGR